MATFDSIALIHSAFPHYAGLPTVDHLAGDASNRVYYRVALGDGGPWPATAVVMQIGGDPLKSNEATGGMRPDELPFLSVQRYLAALDLPVPAIYAIDTTNWLLLLEDLGDEMLYCVLDPASRDERLQVYEQALDLLVEFQRRTATSEPPRVVREQRFEPSFLDWELEHFREYGLRRPLRGAEIAVWEAAKRTIVEHVARFPYVVVHRDYQSRNLMRHRGRLYLIDFQDALFGPATYDLVALLRDSYIDLDEASVETLLESYLQRLRPHDLPLGSDELRELFWWNAVQRKLKDSGRFVFIERVRGNPWFMQFRGRTMGFVRGAIERFAELRELGQLLAEVAEEYPDGPPPSSGARS